jgi:hypothetical protein
MGVTLSFIETESHRWLKNKNEWTVILTAVYLFFPLLFWTHSQLPVASYPSASLKSVILMTYNGFNLIGPLQKRYSELYLSNPDAFKWAGLACYASESVGSGGLVTRYTGIKFEQLVHLRTT